VTGVVRAGAVKNLDVEPLRDGHREIELGGHRFVELGAIWRQRPERLFTRVPTLPSGRLVKERATSSRKSGFCQARGCENNMNHQYFLGRRG